MLDEQLPPTPGWVAMLSGQEADLAEWKYALKQPFDPWVEQVHRDAEMVWALRSRDFDGIESASEVRDRALPLIDRLNGALAVSASTQRVSFQAVGQIGAAGEVSLHMFLEISDRVRLSALSDTVTVEVRDAQGNLVPTSSLEPEPEPTTAQRWVQAGESNSDIGDMLVFAGRADNWFDIYKALELAECRSGGQHGLEKLLGPAASAVRNMRQTANYYRHARGHRPSVLTTQDDATSLLAHVVRTVLSQDQG